LHGAKFDVRTGEVLGPPAYDDVACYSVRVIGTDIEVNAE
jgi:3-phenylpropionate/trans-cinnamate dioxygenase ferredoxin subunit